MDVTIREIEHMNFQPAPNIDHGPELPLIEKQAIIQQCFIHDLRADIGYYEQPTPDGPVYLVTKGWRTIQAIKQFCNNEFKTWDAPTMRRWQQMHKK